MGLANYISEFEMPIVVSDEGKKLTVDSHDKDALYVVFEFPASEAIGNHGPHFGNHPADVELIIATIKDGTASKIKQMPRFGLPVLGTAGPSTRFGPSKAASKRAIRKLSSFLSWTMSSGRIRGDVAERLVPALGLDNNVVVHVKPSVGYSVPGFLVEVRHNLSNIRESLKRKDFETIGLFASLIDEQATELGFGEIAGMGRSLFQASQKGEAKEIQNLLEELSNHMGHLVVTYE